jgi:hypothetical protein
LVSYQAKKHEAMYTFFLCEKKVLLTTRQGLASYGAFNETENE